MTDDLLVPIGKASYCDICHQMRYPYNECICGGKNPHIKERLDAQAKARQTLLKRAMKKRSKSIDMAWFITVPPQFCAYYELRKDRPPRCNNPSNKHNESLRRKRGLCKFDECPLAYKSKAGVN